MSGELSEECTVAPDEQAPLRYTPTCCGFRFHTARCRRRSCGCLAHVARTYDRGYGHSPHARTSSSTGSSLRICPTRCRDFAASASRHAVQRRLRSQHFHGQSGQRGARRDRRSSASMPKSSPASDAGPDFSFLPRNSRSAWHHDARSRRRHDARYLGLHLKSAADGESALQSRLAAASAHAISG